MAASFLPDGFDCVRDAFLGPYRTESDPAAVERGECAGSVEKGNNHCAVLQKKLTLAPGQKVRLVWMLGEGGLEEGRRIRAKYSDFTAVDAAFDDLARFWEDKLGRLQVSTPDPEMDTMLNYTFNGIMQIDRNGVILRVNRAGYDLLERRPSDLLGQTLTAVLPNFNRKVLEDTLFQGKEAYAFLMDIKHKVAIVNLAPIRVDGEIDGAILTFQEGKRVIEMDG